MAIYSSSLSQSTNTGSIHQESPSFNQPLLSHESHCNKGERMETQQYQQGTSFIRTCFNGLNALSGVGILSVPYAVASGGWFGLAFLLLMATVCLYTGLLLRRCMDKDPLIKTYPDIGELAFGTKGRIAISMFMYLELYLVAIEFLIMEGDNLDKLFPRMSFRIAGMVIKGNQGFVLLSALVILPTVWLRNLGLLAYVSAGGVLASVILVGTVFWVGAVDGVGFSEKGRLWDLNGIPTAVSLYAFCYCGHAVFPTICSSMKDRTQFSKVLLICFIICTFTYGSMGIMGYLMYGEDVQSQVTLNLPIGNISSKIAVCTTVINPFTKYAIMISPIAAAIEDSVPFCSNNKLASLLVRTLLVASTVVMALAIPFFGYLMALIGAFLSSTVSLVLPCVCYLKVSKAVRRRRHEMVIVVGILVLGITVAVLGTYSSLLQIIHHL